MRRGPYGSIYAQEGLEAVLMATAFEQPVIVVLVDDAVYQLLRGQRPEGIGMKDFTKVHKALEMYGVESVAVEAESLARRGLTRADMLVDVEVLDGSAIATLMHGADVVFTF